MFGRRTPPREDQTLRLRWDRGLHLDFGKSRIASENGRAGADRPGSAIGNGSPRTQGGLAGDNGPRVHAGGSSLWASEPP